MMSESDTPTQINEPKTQIIGGVSGAELKGFIEKIEYLEEQKAALAADIRDIMADAKGRGYDVKTMRQIIRLRKMKHDDRAMQEELLDLYKNALGMLD